ncbi:MAG: bifunctional glutamate N-acetyltransferase/amino-acid acetyltransferase ArgJ [Gammaproteobacteria bacterium]|nr:bifunctional glutamate N-acetyltransferase/amino-acid acetyltransferase ArgJ [Gammaproteobacteria bacterium]
MAVGLTGLPELYPVAGISLGTAAAGIRYRGRDDLVVMEMAPGGTAAAVFTRNAFCAAPVSVAREHLGLFSPRFLLINAGNANAGTGKQGLADARESCKSLAGAGGCRPAEVLPFSTGVIGEPLPLARLQAGIPALLSNRSGDAAAWERAARAIMTTDTVPKGASRRFEQAGRTVTVTGIAKGSGMIHPDMATMLAYVATDAAVERELLSVCLKRAVDRSFNRISVDGDTSTNDACVLLASGGTGLPAIEHEDDPALASFQEALDGVCLELAQAIIRDGEGATKFITVRVEGGATPGECAAVAFTIAHSPLVKTACFASDPNWGRILAAVGRAGLEGLDISRVTIHLDDVSIVMNGGRHPDYREEMGAAVMKRPEFTIRVNLGRGDHTTEVWTTDLSYDYVKINAEYRS